MEETEARNLLQSAVWENDGTFTILRLGDDPGKERIYELRVALRVLWRHWRTQPSLPFDITQAAAYILLMRDEAIANIKSRQEPLRAEVLGHELPDLWQGAYEVLAGAMADTDGYRPDLDK